LFPIACREDPVRANLSPSLSARQQNASFFTDNPNSRADITL